MDEKQKDKKKQEQPVTVNITNNNQFQKGVGAFITNLNHLTIVMDSEGNMTTLGELNNEPDPNQYASMENPEVAPDMPDYMNEANIDDMNILA